MTRDLLTGAWPHVVLLACVALALSSNVALAQVDGRASVRLSLDACPTLAAERVRSIVGAELGGLLIAEGEPTTAATTEVSVACEAASTTITARDTETGMSLVRQVELEPVHPLARERLVAIAIAELVTAMGIELDHATISEPAPVPAPAPTPAPAPAPPAEAPSVVTAPPPTRRELTLLGAAAVYGRPRRGVFGGGLRFEHGVGPRGRFGVAVTLTAERAEVANLIGDIVSTQLAIGLDATLGRYRERFAVQGIAGVACGLVRMAGKPIADTILHGTFLAPILAPRIGARVLARPTRRFFVTSGLELAIVAVTAHALVDGERAVSVEGPTLTLQLGLGLVL